MATSRSVSEAGVTMTSRAGPQEAARLLVDLTADRTRVQGPNHPDT
ncbi:hypothetical protein ACFWSJ_16915 [Streptomyces niveus]